MIVAGVAKLGVAVSCDISICFERALLQNVWTLVLSTQ